MQSLKNKIVLITGASSGIGKACAEYFAKSGAHLILTARRVERLESLSQMLKTHGVDSLSLEMDVQDKIQVSKTLAVLPDRWRNIDILVNNAGLALDSLPIQEGNIDHWDTMINTNVHGLLYVTRTILPGMIERNSGHIVNIGSVAGHDCYSTGNVYCATKHAVRAISQGMRIDLLGTNIKVTEIDPGAVHTEFSAVRWKDKEKSDKFYDDFTPLVAEDIADAIIYATTRPAHVNISEMIIYPVDQASANHLHKPGRKQ